MNKVKQCADCRNGEHDNYTDDVTLVFVRDLDTKKIIKRANMCSQHIEMYLGDGYEVVDCKTKRSLGEPVNWNKINKQDELRRENLKRFYK